MNKYRNRPTVRGSIRFDSRAEARRYAELELLQAAGVIRDLRPHPSYVLQDKFKHQGQVVRAIRYEGDAEYFDVETGRRTVEDVKGGRATRTAVFEIKRKMFMYKYPDIELRIVEA